MRIPALTLLSSGARLLSRSSTRTARRIMLITIAAAFSTPVYGQLEFERHPINYSKATPTDAASRLNARLEAGDTHLEHDTSHGFLRSMLTQLNVPVSSQVLVFSKTSLQRHRISPRTPRAVYFNDDIYVGWVQRGDVIELSAADPQLGAVFYTFDQEPTETPTFQRQIDHCTICHASTHTRRMPGHIVRSVFPDRSGMPVFSAGTFRTDHTSPFKERWGGWYVSGTHGRDRHMGNVVVHSPKQSEKLDVEAGANHTSLAELVDTDPYLSPHSDIAALMVLEHQAAMHNRLTEAGFNGRFAKHDARVMNTALERPADFESESTRRRFQSAAKTVVHGLLMVGEYQLTDAVSGTSGFADEFASRGPFDSQGRTLRQLDLRRRLFRFPCSYLIYSEAFDALPPEVRELVYRQLWDILNDADTSGDYAHLTAADRSAVLEILRETKPNLPSYWRTQASSAS